MVKKRKCRYTQLELDIHEQAVKLRKMTDKQLVDAFNEARCSPHKISGTSEMVEFATHKDNTEGVKMLLKELSEGKCKGIKIGTVYKLTEFAAEMGLL